MAIKLHNTLTGTTEEFTTLEPGHVKMYHCGPTVYGVQHIGNLSMFVFTDILRRTLEYSGFNVSQVINITDFGHLLGDNEGDADQGEDRMTKGLRQEGIEPTLENMSILAEKYASIFLSDIAELNTNTQDTQFPRASHYIDAQIEMIKTLEAKGFTYQGSGGVYFDTSKFPDYGKLGNIKLESLKEGARIGVDTSKRNPTDFLLWKGDQRIGWDSPWGKGFPGWHIECSAMIFSILGEQIDIHTGGIEHIAVHHNNEIAQSESASGKKPFSRFWLHRSHLQIEGTKIAKSTGNTVYLSDIKEKATPLALRYLFLGAHYRTPSNFTWEALSSAETALKKLKELVSSLPEGGVVHDAYKNDFLKALENDLNTPEALAVIWNLVKDDSVSPQDIRATLLDFDQVLGLNLEHNEYRVTEIPEEIKELLSEREQARNEKNWQKSDELRDEISKKGFTIKDTDTGQHISRL